MTGIRKAGHITIRDEDAHNHECQRCYFTWLCTNGKCKIPIDTEGRCEFCRKLTNAQCAELRNPIHCLHMHMGLYGKTGLRVAKVLGIDSKKVNLER